MVLIGCCEAVIAIFFPPLAVLLRKGCSGSLLINILLTILGWIPGVIHAWFIIAAEPGHHHDKHPRTSHSSRHRHSSGGRHHHHHGHGGGSSHAGRHHHHHGHHGSHTGRHHSRPPRKSYDRDGYGGGIAPPRYGGPPPMRPGSGYGPPPPPMQEMGYAPPPMRSRY